MGGAKHATGSRPSCSTSNLILEQDMWVTSELNWKRQPRAFYKTNGTFVRKPGDQFVDCEDND